MIISTPCFVFLSSLFSLVHWLSTHDTDRDHVTLTYRCRMPYFMVAIFSPSLMSYFQTFMSYDAFHASRL